MASHRQCFYCKNSFQSSEFHNHLKQCPARQQKHQPSVQKPYHPLFGGNQSKPAVGLDVVQRRLEEVSEQKEIANATVKSLEDMVRGLQSNLKNYSANNAKLAAAVEAKEAIIDGLKSEEVNMLLAHVQQISAKDDQIRSQKVQLQNANDALNKEQSQNTVLRAQIQLLQLELSEHNERIEHLEAEKEQNQAEIARLRQNTTSLVTSLETEGQKWSEEIKKETALRLDAQNQYERVQSEVTKMRQEMQRKEQEFEDEMERLKESESALIGRHQEEISRRETERDLESEKVRHLRNAVNEERKANSLLKQQIGTLQEEEKEREVMVQELKEEIKALKLQCLDESKYDEWNHEEIAAWIMNLDGDRFEKLYGESIRMVLEEEQVSGSDLKKIKKEDVKRWGITKFADFDFVHEHIQRLTADKIGNEHPSVHSNVNPMSAGAANEGDDSTGYHF